MKFLLVADEESPYIWDYFDIERYRDVDLIISAGDLKAQYLEFLVSMIPVDLLYVHGNHDGGYDDNPPLGCICIENDIYIHKGIRILGLGGSYRYSNGKHQYTELEMQKRINKLKRKIKKHKGFDILVAHSPAFGHGDGKDLAHRGFECFNELIRTYKPKYFIHGHQHMNYGWNQKRIYSIDETTCINAYMYHKLEYV
jgi:Icc-related predicted phosphoesterase